MSSTRRSDKRNASTRDGWSEDVRLLQAAFGERFGASANSIVHTFPVSATLLEITASISWRAPRQNADGRKLMLYAEVNARWAWKALDNYALELWKLLGELYAAAEATEEAFLRSK